MRVLIITLTIGVLGIFAIAGNPPQTPAEIQAEMQRADEMPITGASINYQTPLKSFQTYWDAVKRMDGSRFQSMTSACKVRIFGTNQDLTADQLAGIAAGHQRLKERIYQLIGFTYTSDPSNPVIVITYSYDTTVNAQDILNREVERITFTRAESGWKVDQSVEDIAD